MKEPTKAKYVYTPCGCFIIPPDVQRRNALEKWASEFKTIAAIEEEIAKIRLQERDLDDKVRVLMAHASKLGVAS